MRLDIEGESPREREIRIEVAGFADLLGRTVAKAKEIQALLTPDDDLFFELEAFVQLSEER